MKRINFESFKDILPMIEAAPTPEYLPSLENMTVDELYSRSLTGQRWDDLEVRNIITVPKFKTCNRCYDGYTPHDRIDAMVPCKHCLQPWLKAQRVERARLPVDATGKTFATYKLTNRFKAIRDQVAAWSKHRQKEKGALLYGPAGTGKSHFAYSIAHQLLWLNFKVRYATHTSLLDLERATWNDKTKHSPLRTLLKDIDVLILDEIGGVGGGYGKVTDWQKRTTSEMLDSIYRQWSSGSLYVLFISNVPLDTFMKTYNRALQSRLQEMIEPVFIDQKDKRNM